MTEIEIIELDATELDRVSGGFSIEALQKMLDNLAATAKQFAQAVRVNG